ncbi:MAG: hypothetical protein WAU45_24370 [Blastocatellia bacterium]
MSYTRWFYSRDGLRAFPRENYVALAIGVLVASSGVLIIDIASPSPHGYIELLIGVPIICSGLFISGVALLARFLMLNWPVRLFALALLLSAIVPVLRIALLFIGA